MPETPRFNVQPLSELLAKDFGPEPAEAAYRRGYRDGLIQMVNALGEAPDARHIDAKRLDTLMQWALDFWQGDLFDWEKRGRMANAQREEAPTLYWPGEAPPQP